MADGLINLQTDLKSLRYGSDKPYITKDVNNPPSSNQTGMQITKRIDDTSRIAQMLIDRPGLKFIGNQALLQQVDIQGKLEKARDKKSTLGGKIFEQVKNTVKGTAQILGSTLAQVPVNGTGTHFVYAFRTDTYLQPLKKGDVSAFKEFFGEGGVEGAPLALRGKEITGIVSSKFGEENEDGEFIASEEALGKYNYNGEIKPLYDEKENTNILDFLEKEQQPKNLAKTGAPIKVTSLFAQEGSSTQPTFNTTLATGSLGVSNKDLAGDISQLQQPDIKPFREEDQKKKAKNSTSSNISNALTGSTITVNREVETTASPDKNLKNPQNTIKSVPNTNVVGSGFSFKDNNLENKYSNGSTYTGNTTQETVLGASTGSIPLNNFNNPDSEIKSRPILGSGNDKVIDANSVNRNVSDFRTGPTSFNYSSPTINKETRINLGNQGKNTGAVSYSTVDRDKIDQLNALDISTNSRVDGTDAARDLAKFYFEIITPDEKTFLHFRAHIDSIDDSYSGDWDSHQYVGRAEEFFTYKGFKRDISVGFKISAQSRAEMKPLYRKMVYLASATAPTYGGGSNFMRGTLARLTIGSYFSQIPGIITSVKYTWQTDYMWEIAMQNPEGGIDDDQQELPMTLDCSISFKPIHDFAPQTGLKYYFTAPQENLKGGAKSFF